MEAGGGGRVRICHDASNRAHGAGLPHVPVFYSTGGDDADEADLNESAIISDTRVWKAGMSPPCVRLSD